MGEVHIHFKSRFAVAYFNSLNFFTASQFSGDGVIVEMVSFRCHAFYIAGDVAGHIHLDDMKKRSDDESDILANAFSSEQEMANEAYLQDFFDRYAELHGKHQALFKKMFLS